MAKKSKTQVATTAGAARKRGGGSRKTPKSKTKSVRKAAARGLGRVGRAARKVLGGSRGRGGGPLKKLRKRLGLKGGAKRAVKKAAPKKKATKKKK